MAGGVGILKQMACELLDALGQWLDLTQVSDGDAWMHGLARGRRPDHALALEAAKPLFWRLPGETCEP